MQLPISVSLSLYAYLPFIVSEIQRFISRKSAFFAVLRLPTPVSFESLVRGLLWDIAYESWCPKNEIRGLYRW